MSVNSLTYPWNDVGDKKARVSLKSYSWLTSTHPNLSNTQDIFRGKQNTDIRLYLPGNFSEHFSADWGVEGLVSFGVNDFNWKGFSTSGQEVVNNFGLKVGMDGVVNTGKFLAGETHYPGEFLTFKKGNPNTLSFTFDLLPRESKDAEAINNIITTLKRTILPVYKSGRLQYPDVWQIIFSGIKGPGHPATPQTYNDMALTDVTPTYSGGQQSALVFHDGYPVNVQLQLTFKSIKHSYLESV